MRIPSRYMPARAVQTMSWAGELCFISILVGMLALPGLVWWPLAFPLPAVFLLMTLIGWRNDARIAKIRSDETICDFAQSFDCRVIDTWIVRAVFEEFSDRYPIRSNDSFEDDLDIDGEDLDDSIVEVAKRVGRSLDEIEANPMNGKIETVYDLVTFLQHQPELAIRTAQ